MTVSDAHFRVVSIPGAPDCVIQVGGDIVVQTAARFQEALLEALVAWPNRLIVDLAQVDTIDVTGIAVLISAHHRGKADGTELVLQAPSPPVSEAIEATHLRDLPHRDSITNARPDRALRPSPSPFPPR